MLVLGSITEKVVRYVGFIVLTVKGKMQDTQNLLPEGPAGAGLSIPPRRFRPTLPLYAAVGSGRLKRPRTKPRRRNNTFLMSFLIT